MSQAVVETKGLTKRYGDFTALEDLSLTVNRGQILGFIGPNGAGKTTTIRILVGLAKPTTGSASIAGADCVRESRKIKRLVGYMPDTFGGYDNMRVREYLDFFGAAFAIPRRERGRRITDSLEAAGAVDFQDRFVESLSHGMKQRVGIARTLLHDPQVLILDEPANGLDPAARIEMRQILLRLAAKGKTLIVTSHILPELARICDVVAILSQGRLRAFGSLDQIMRSVRQRRVVELQLTTAGDVPAAAQIVADNIEPGAPVDTSPTEAVVRFTTAVDDQRLAGILAIAVGHGIGVVQFHELPLDLEDAFLEVTRQDRVPDADNRA
ncbi:MAG: ABC transporter ATP-binding protein [Planctomycetes bacterium]|nr:ABC transporter ATP-binding protein [Planctomycetota bacterium]